MSKLLIQFLILVSLMGCAATDEPAYTESDTLVNKVDTNLSATVGLISLELNSRATGLLLNANEKSYLLLNKHTIQNDVPNQLTLLADFEQVEVDIPYGIFLSSDADFALLKVASSNINRLSHLPASLVKLSTLSFLPGDKLLCAMISPLRNYQTKRYYKTFFVAGTPSANIIEVDSAFEHGQSGSPCFDSNGGFVGIAKGFHKAESGESKIGFIEVLSTNVIPDYLNQS